jgi:transcriptional regulator with XRE-family HTH domain
MTATTPPIKGDVNLRLARNIRLARTAAGLSQRELGMKARIPRPHVVSMENGNRPISVTTVLKVAHALGLDYGWFYSEHEDEEGDPDAS